MKFSLFKEHGALNSKPVFAAFEHSLRNQGHTVCNSDMHCDVAVIWSVLWSGRMRANRPVWEYYRKTHRPVVVLEVGSIQRGITWRIGINGIGNNSRFVPAGQGSARAKLLGIKARPWRNHGTAILVCAQNNKSLLWHGQPSVEQWFLSVYNTIRSCSDRPIVLRPHPRCAVENIDQTLHGVSRQCPVQLTNTYDDYDLCFDDVWATVNWSSNPGVLSVINGVPAFTGPDSVAHAVANVDFNNIETPCMPDRTQWINDLAWREYTVEEIAQGLPLKYLTNHL
jgi:hypothetical protein